MKLRNCLIFLLFVSIFLSSCEKDEINDSIIVQVTNQLSVDGIDYDIKLYAVSTQEEVFDEYNYDGELVLFESTSKEIDLASSGETTIYSDTWTVHFAYKATNDVNPQIGSISGELPLLNGGNRIGIIEGFNPSNPLATTDSIETRWNEAINKGMTVERLQTDWSELKPSPHKDNIRVI